jgi:hypothetical protein
MYMVTKHMQLYNRLNFYRIVKYVFTLTRTLTKLKYLGYIKVAFSYHARSHENLKKFIF